MRRLALIVFAFVMLAAPSFATVYTLAPDGSGDFATIQAAVNGCMNGDEIHLLDGVYSGTGNYDIDFMGRDNVILKSVSGNASACIIDVEGIHGNYISEQGIFFDSGETGVVVEDITIRNADGDAG